MSTNIVPESNRPSIRRTRFIKIAEYRVNKILDGLDNLGKCSNRNNYEYSEEEVRKIFREIEHKIKEIKIQFQGGAKSKGKFKL